MKQRNGRQYVAVLALSWLGALGCGRSDESKRAEVASVTVAIDRLRDAPNANKAEFLGTLERTACTLEDVCALKRLCVEAYGLQVATLGQIEQLKSGALESGRIAERLESMQSNLTRAHDGAKSCIDAEARLLERYRARKDPKK